MDRRSSNTFSVLLQHNSMEATLAERSVIDLSRAYGPILIGTFISTAFWGMTCLQTFMYFEAYERDKWPIKSLVVILWALDTIHEIFCIKGLWAALIDKFGVPADIISHHEFVWQFIVTCVVAAMVQAFFTWRIWRFANKGLLWPVILIPLIIIQIVCSLVFVARPKPGGLIMATNEIGPFIVPNLAFVVSVTVIDILIAVIMSVLLWRGRTGFMATDRLILRLMNASVSTGACTAFFGLAGIIAAGASPRDLFYLVGEISLCALYCNAALANLNSRRYIRARNPKSRAYANIPSMAGSIQLANLSPLYDKNMVESPK